MNAFNGIISRPERTYNNTETSGVSCRNHLCNSDILGRHTFMRPFVATLSPMFPARRFSARIG